MTRSIQGKVVAITGGARGIGYATAQKLIAQGATVAIGDIDAIQLKQAGTELGVNTCPTVDVTSIDSFTDFLDEVERSLGPIDVLINNAGVMPVGLVVDEDDAVTERMLDINLLGVITGTKLALRRMQPRGGGHIINIASLAGETYFPGFATYCATKYGVLGFSDAARLESAGIGVAISSVLPTFTNTELTSGIGGTKGLKDAQPEEIAAAISETHPQAEAARAGDETGRHSGAGDEIPPSRSRSDGPSAGYRPVHHPARCPAPHRLRRASPRRLSRVPSCCLRASSGG